MRWYSDAFPSQQTWQPGVLQVCSDGHRYIDGWPHVIDDRENALRVCDHDVRIPWSELGKEFEPVPIRVPSPVMTRQEAGFCTACLRLTSVWDLMWQAAYNSWKTVERFRKRWQECAFNADKRSDDVNYVWPYRLFVRRDGPWRIINLETDAVPTDALAWCGIISDAAKDTTYTLVGVVTTGYAQKPEQSLIDAPIFGLPILDLTPTRFIEMEYEMLKGWALRNLSRSGCYLTALAYASQLDRIARAQGVVVPSTLVAKLLDDYERASLLSSAI